MRHVNNFLKAFIVVAIVSTNCFSQAVSNSIPNDGCRTIATGSLTVTHSYNSVSRWEELELLGEGYYAYARTVGNTSKTFNYSTSLGETYYRAKLLGGTNVYSQIVTIRNFPPPVTGTLSGAATYQGTGTGTLTLSGYSGPITKWQQSTNGINWSDIAHTSSTYSYSNLTQSTHFRAYVGGTAPCVPMPSNSVLVTIYPFGPLSCPTPTEGCRTSASGTITVGNYASVIRWEEGQMQGSNFVITNIINDTHNYYFFASSLPKVSYRAKLATDIYSSVMEFENVTPPVAGTLSGAATFTENVSGSLSLSSYSGQIIKWQSSIDGSSWYDMAHTSASYNYNNLAQTTHYRVVVDNGVCDAVTSNSVTISVIAPPPLSNSIANDGCRTLATGTLTVDYPIVDQWEEGEVLGEIFYPIYTYSTHLPTYNYSTTAPETFYRAKLATNMYSTVIRIRNFYPPIAGTLSASAVYEESGSGILTLNGYSDQIVKWESSPNESTWSDITHSSATYPYNVTQSGYYRVVVGREGCPNVTSYPVYISIQKKGTLSGSSSMYKDGVANLTLSGHNVPVLGWEYSFDGGTTWITENCTVATFNLPITGNTSFRAKLNFYSLGTRYSNVHTVTLNSSTYTQANPVTGVAGQNYVRVQRVGVSGITTPAEVDALTATSKHEAFSYADGLGRGVQAVAAKASPLQKDLVSFSVYDKYGMNSKQYLPYVAATGTGSYAGNSLADQTAFYANGTSDKIEDTPHPFAETKFDDSPLFRVTEQGSVGSDWQPGGGHTARTAITSNADNEVRQFNSDGSSSGFYPANELVVMEVTDNDNRKRQVIKDKFGRTLLTKTQLDETIDGTSVPWLETYNIYYPDGQIRYVISPKGMNALKNGSWSFTQSIKDQYVYVFVYDTFGRLVEKKTPGQAPVYYCYDILNRLLLVQDGNIRPQNKWFYIKYDRLGRPVMQGLYTNATHTTRTAVQTNVINPLFSVPTAKYYEERGTASHGYTNQVFPTSGSEVLTVNYYSSYDFDFNGTNEFSYTAQSLAGEATPGTTTIGMPTGSKRLIMGTSTWLSEYYFYDADGRVIQKRSNNHLSATIDNLATIVYDFEGKQTLQKMFHKTSSNTTTVINRLVYDHAGRVKEIWQSNNASAEQLLVQYHYNELGQLTDKKLHDKGSSQFLQSVDFRYNIQGWIKSINNSQLSNDGIKNDETDDYFGMEMLYNETEAGVSSNALFSGNINALKWKGAGVSGGAADQQKYSFTYDKANRLKGAVSAMNNGIAWTKDMDVLNENMTYDHNGNILNLQRYRKDVILETAALTDNLTYTYNTAMGDQLQKVTDASASTLGFNNGSSGTSNDYTYDAQGNLLSDLNKGISSVVYNELGKAKQVNFSDGRKIDYVFDAAGNKLTMKTWQGSTLLTTTDYVGGFVYENNTLNFFGSPEGRVVNKSGTLEYQYSIADHQGNTRVVFTSATPSVQASAANFETSTNPNFQNYTNRVNFELMDKTDFSGSTYSYSQKLTGGANSQVGLAKSMKVFPGDKVKIEAFAKYYNPQGTQGNITGFALALTSAFGVSSSSTGEALKAYNALEGYGGFIASGGSEGSTSYPKLYVNILLFDEDHNFVDAAWQQIDGGEQVGVSPKAAHDYMMQEVTVKEAGYAYIYVSNENPTLVEFYVDDVVVTHTPTNVIQYNEYYPFGLQTANSWTRENSNNNFLYNAGNELNKTSGWYEMFFRGYDPAIGRMLQVDPYASSFASFSPYTYAASNPVMINDPSGGTFTVLDHLADRNNDLENMMGLSSNAGGSGGGGASRGGSGIDPYAAMNFQQMNKDAREMSPQEYAAKYGTTYSPGDLINAGFWQTVRVVGQDKVYISWSDDFSWENIIEGTGTNGGCPPGVDCDYVARAAKDGLFANAVGTVESGYSLWESKRDYSKVPLMYSKSFKSVGLGLSAATLGLGGYLIRQQVKNGQSVNPIDVVQFGVGAVGLFSSALNYAGIGVRLTGPISATAGIFGMVLSIPSNWYNVYKGAYEMQYVSTPYYPSDSEIFGGN